MLGRHYLPAVVLGVSYKSYTNQVMCIKWNGGQSKWFQAVFVLCIAYSVFLISFYFYFSIVLF